MQVVRQEVKSNTQNQKTVLKKPDLTIEQIIPKWSRILASGKKLDSDQKKAIKDLRACVVGEAHNNSDRYYESVDHYCRDCIDFSMTIPDEYKYFAMGYARNNFQNTIEFFVDHYNKDHKQEWYNRHSPAK